MNSEQEKLNKALSGIAGEYFVAAEPSRHGMVAAVTLRNTRGIDIVVSRLGVSRSATVQVKTVQNRPAKWLLNKSDEKSKGPNHRLTITSVQNNEDIVSSRGRKVRRQILPR